MSYSSTNTIQKFPQKGGWFYIPIDQAISKKLAVHADRGLIAVTATVGKTSWDTSLLPMGDRTHFIALNKKVMESERVELGSHITVSFSVRQRSNKK